MRIEDLEPDPSAVIAHGHASIPSAKEISEIILQKLPHYKINPQFSSQRVFSLQNSVPGFPISVVLGREQGEVIVAHPACYGDAEDLTKALNAYNSYTFKLKRK
jgi:hypothetical protein